MALFQKTKVLHWCGWAVLPFALVTYPLVLLLPGVSEGDGVDPWTSVAFHGAMLASGVVGYGCRRLGIWLFHGRRGRPLATWWDALLYLVLNGLAIGGYGFMMAVSLVPCFQGVRYPWLGLFVVVGFVSVVSCCPSLWPPGQDRRHHPR